MTVGGLFALDYFASYSIYRTWPILLILFGALKLVEKLPGGDEDEGAGTPVGGQA
jgi:hypothetical protein